MAQKTIVHLVDDLDGGDAHESVTFSLDGIEYSIDLSDENAATLRNNLAEFVANAQRIGGRKQRGAPAAKVAVKAGGDRAQNQAIREWARANGKKISDRGPSQRTWSPGLKQHTPESGNSGVGLAVRAPHSSTPQPPQYHG
jgi:Lsr2